MGNCIYCGKPAGLLKTHHKECKEKNKSAWNAMLAKAKDAALGNVPLDGLKQDLQKLAQNGYMSEDKVREGMIEGWEEAVLHFLEDGNLDSEEEATLTSYAEHFGFAQDDLDKKGIYTRLVKGAVLNDIMQGKIPQRIHTDTPLPFNFQKHESLVWVFPNVKYYEMKTHREYVGGSSGASIRIAKGVYYRIGAFKGHPVETEENVYIDSGMLAVTTKNIYFYSSKKTFKVPFSKIVSFTPYADGIGIQRDAASAKPRVFVTGDGWFTYNLVTNLAKNT
jgi:hypothetical protein